MATPHNNAPDGAFAKTVLMPGDPLRAKYIVENFLDDVQLVTSVRNVYGYTGKYKGVPISVMASGMGMPSMGIYSYELFSFYGVENIIRIGSSGSYDERVKVMDVVLASAAYSMSSFADVMSGVKDDTMYPSAEINAVIRHKAEELGVSLHHEVIRSSDVFYGGEGGQTWQEVHERTGAVCVEMESFALFHIANVLGKRAACLLTISDSLVTGTAISAEERQESFRTMMKLALESAILL
ncbi:MAG: purine-nucleoside phosphorylase [Muribaculaceae bacterium]|nr:purine-nucleoside phosphorylase [Muribaculaceae bacterium]